MSKWQILSLQAALKWYLPHLSSPGGSLSEIKIGGWAEQIYQVENCRFGKIEGTDFDPKVNSARTFGAGMFSI